MSSGGGSKSSSTSTTQTQVINPALANAAQQVGQQQFVRYDGPRVASPSTTQAAGADAIRANATSQAWKPGMDSATSLATSGAGATDISALLAKVAQLSNPYEDTVVKNTLGDMQTELDRNLTNQRLRSGGSELGIRQLFAENELTKSGLSTMGRTAGELRSSGFNNALSSAIGLDQADKGRAFSGATTLAGLTQAADALSKGDANALYGLGKDDTARTQAGLDANFEEFMRQQGWSKEQLAAWADAFSKSTGTMSTSTSTSSQSNGIGDLLSGAGALVKGAAAFSDRRLKRDCTPIGRDRAGRRWWTYRYVWDAPGVRRLGVMAQEILRSNPAAVLRHPSGFLMVDYSALGA